MKDIQGGSE